MHVPFGASVPFENETEGAPAAGAKVGVPQPEVDALGGLATIIAAGEVGKVSEKLAPVIVSDVGFVMVNVSVDEPPATVELGANAFEMVREVTSTMLAMRAPAEKSLL